MMTKSEAIKASIKDAWRKKYNDDVSKLTRRALVLASPNHGTKQYVEALNELKLMLCKKENIDYESSALEALDNVVRIAQSVQKYIKVHSSDEQMHELAKLREEKAELEKKVDELLKVNDELNKELSTYKSKVSILENGIKVLDKKYGSKQPDTSEADSSTSEAKKRTSASKAKSAAKVTAKTTPAKTRTKTSDKDKAAKAKSSTTRRKANVRKSTQTKQTSSVVASETLSKEDSIKSTDTPDTAVKLLESSEYLKLPENN